MSNCSMYPTANDVVEITATLRHTALKCPRSSDVRLFLEIQGDALHRAWIILASLLLELFLAS